MPNNKDEQRDILAYRMEAVENQIKEVLKVLSRRENITKQDLNEFKDIIVDRILEVKLTMQTQIDDLKEEKASKESVDFLSRIVWWGLGIVATTLAAVIALMLRGGFK